MLTLELAQGDRSERLIAGDQRYQDHRFLRLISMQQGSAVLNRRLRQVFIDDQRRAGAQDVRTESGVVERCRRNGDPLAVNGQVRVTNQAGLRVHDADAHVRLFEDLADLVAYGIVDALDGNLAGERLLHAVDNGELGRALLALLEQALRFIEQPRVFECHAHAVGERLQQPYVGVAEGVLALHVDQIDHPAHLLARYQRHHDERFLHPGARKEGRAVLLYGLCHVFVDKDRFARAYDVGTESTLGA